ncbi:calcium-responsive transcription factor isoform X1, partial [Lates japonicus]
METVADRNTCLEPEQSADAGSAPPAGPTLSDPAADTWMTSQQQTPCQNQLVIVEPRGQMVPCERMVIVTGQSEGREVFVIPGFCCSEAELEAVLLLHKQQTGCVFGTRQSPSVDKPATRLMWKSQYVPYDGIPFVNTGSRAIVME